MHHFRRVLLEVWREASRHIEIQESTVAFASLLAKELPLAQIIVRRIDPQQMSLATVATAPAERLAVNGEPRRQFTETDFSRLAKWCRSGRLLRRGKRMTGALGLVLPPEVPGDVLAAPLVGPSGPEGVVLLIAREDRAFEPAHLEILEALREPFTVAMENDRRLHEMASLREAAEADRGALLRRLGRTDLGDTIVGEQSGLNQVMKRVELVANSDVPVLILGETGTGKELVARALHVRGSRHQGPFIRVNCGAIPSELIDSQLFGHEKGSFTGAESARQGWFERADGGTLFLDEIGELPLDAQVRFLRVLQDGFVERVGSTQPIHVDVRVVAATHRDLALMVSEKRFREDLWYRVAVFPILLPPLRDRLDDIADFAHHFAERAALRFGLSAVKPREEDIELLKQYDWPGNIRELGAVLDRAAILGDGKTLEVSMALGWTEDRKPLSAAHHHLAVTSPSAGDPARAVAGSSNASGVGSLDEVMRAHIEKVLQRTGGRIEGRNGAAALLKINPHTLRARMRKLRIDWARFRPSQEPDA